MYCFCILFIILIIFILYTKYFKQNEHFTNIKSNDEKELLKDINNLTDEEPKLPELPDYNSIQNKIIKRDKPVIEKRTVVRSMHNKCRFVPSHTATKCDDKKYKKFSGASLGIGAKSIQCNGQKLINNRAKAIALVDNGKIDKIQLTKKGNYYKKEPKVKIVGNCKSTAIARAIMKEGQIKNIVVLNKGKGYKSSPQIIIDAPNLFSYCNLCCTV